MVLLEAFGITATYTAIASGTYVWAYNGLLNGKKVRVNGEDHEVISLPSDPLGMYITLTRLEKKWVPPTYINAGSGSGIGVGIPVGGGLEEDEEIIFQKVLTTDSSKDINGCRITDFYNSIPLNTYKHNKTFYINNDISLMKYFKKHRIDESQLAITLPIKISERIPSHETWSASRMRICGSSKMYVARSYAKNIINLKYRFFPEVALATCILGVGVALTWEEQKQRLRWS